MVARRLVIDRPRPAADQRDEFEIGEPLDERPRQQSVADRGVARRGNCQLNSL